jgi:adenosylcobinamide-phosphate synthase
MEISNIIPLSLSLILAVLLDHWLGEPQKYHPLVFFGNLANRIEKKMRNPLQSSLWQRIMGLLALSIMTLPIVLLIYSLQGWPVFDMIIAPVILYFCIAANSLKQHALSIFIALEKRDLTSARNSVGMIVSRQTDKMTEDDVRKAAIESVLENGADAIFAPIFWFIVAGPAGAILYRLSNTLDAMWGYKNQKFLYFGWTTARFDDVLNWIPARLTALSYALLGHTQRALYCWKTQAPLLESPNAGPVMTSGAGALNLRLGGSAWYHGKLKQKVFFGTTHLPDNNDIPRANSLITASLVLWVFFIIVLEILGEILA